MLTLLTASLLLAVPAFAQETPPPPIVNGDTTSNYKPVGGLVACESNGCWQFCSGTLIADEWVLTAAHCLDGMNGYDVYFMVGANVWDTSNYDVAVDLIPHPDYNDRTLENDIGLMELQSGVSGVTPYGVNQDTVNNGWIGDELLYVGYGITSDNANDGGTKRYAWMPVADYDSNFIYGLDTADEQNLCSGDSGGASLEENGDSYDLVGVNSFVFAYEYSNSTCVGGGSGVTRVDQHIDWIEDYVDLDSTGSGDGGGDGGSGDGGSGDGGSGDGGSGDGGGDGGGIGPDGGGSDGGDDTGTDTPDRPDDDDDDDDGGGDWRAVFGCSTVPVPAAATFGLAMLALAGRRRRDS